MDAKTAICYCLGLMLINIKCFVRVLRTVTARSAINQMGFRSYSESDEPVQHSNLVSSHSKTKTT